MSGDCEIVQYYKWKERTAKKSHGCCECTAPILPGEKYLQVNACWDNRPCVERQHLLCAEACEYVRDMGLNDDECVYYGGLKEWWSDWIKEGYCHDADLKERGALWRLMLSITRRERKATKQRNLKEA